jgi:uncharacterized protein with HEPN domain
LNRRAPWRLLDVKQSILEIRALLDNTTFDMLMVDRPRRAAFERFLEILSEASRGIPSDWKTEFGSHIPWRQIADLGNHIRHSYHKIDAQILWAVYEDDLGSLELVIDRMMAAYGPDVE